MRTNGMEIGKEGLRRAGMKVKTSKIVGPSVGV